MAEQYTNALVSPSATLATSSITAGTTTTFTVSWNEPSPPTDGTYTLRFNGTATDGSDDALFRVSAMSSATVISNGTWEKVGSQTTFTSGAEIDLDYSAASVTTGLGTKANLTHTHAATDIGAGTVSDTEFGYLDGVTSSIQTQLNAKAADSLVVHLAGTETLTGVKIGPNGSASATTWAARATGNGMYSSAASTLDFASAGTRAVGITSSEFQVQSTRNIRCFGGITLNRVTGTTTKPQYSDLTGGDPTINTGSGINPSVKTWDVDDGTHFDQSITPKLLFCESEIMVQTASISGNTILNAERGQCGTAAASHADGTPIYDYDPSAPYGNILIPTNSFRLSLTLSPLSADIVVWTPPRASIGSWTPPADTTTYEITVDNCNGFNVVLKEPNTFGTLGTFTNGPGEGIGFEIAFDASAGKFNIRSSYGEV